MRTTLVLGVLAVLPGGAGAQVIGFPAGVPGLGTPYSSPGWGIYAPGYSHGLSMGYGTFRPYYPVPSAYPRPAYAPPADTPRPLLRWRRVR